MDVEKIREVVKKAELLHKEFQKTFLRAYSLSSNWDFDELRGLLLTLHEVIEKKFDVASEIVSLSSLIRGRFSLPELALHLLP